MNKVMTGLRFYFRNGETWTVGRDHIGDLWIKQVTTSYGRIGNSDFQEIHPCESLRVEIFQEADSVKSNDINLGGLEAGMFERVKKYADIEKMDILYHDADHPESDAGVQADLIYFPYDSADVDGNDNSYQSSKLADGRLYIVIDPDRNVDDIYPNN